jgi:hypothetical protein
MPSRLRIWREIALPLWRWVVLIPFAVLGLWDTIRDDLIGSTNPIFHLGYWLPEWPWYCWTLIIAGLSIVIVLEGAYRAIAKRDDLLIGIFSPEKIIAQLVELQQKGLRIYKNVDCTPQAYIENLKRWEADVEKILTENFSVSELHTFQTRGFYNGGQYAVSASKEWLETTEEQRIHTSARIWALHHIIEYGSSEFMGPRLKAAQWLEDHYGT